MGLQDLVITNSCLLFLCAIYYTDKGLGFYFNTSSLFCSIFLEILLSQERPQSHREGVRGNRSYRCLPVGEWIWRAIE